MHPESLKACLGTLRLLIGKEGISSYEQGFRSLCRVLTSYDFLASHMSISPEPFQRTDISMKPLEPTFTAMSRNTLSTITLCKPA
jgi:hypothetical protein